MSLFYWSTFGEKRFWQQEKIIDCVDHDFENLESCCTLSFTVLS